MTPEDSPSGRTQRTRSLGELSEITERLDDFTLFCLLADCEPIGFEQTRRLKYVKSHDQI